MSSRSASQTQGSWILDTWSQLASSTHLRFSRKAQPLDTSLVWEALLPILKQLMLQKRGPPQTKCRESKGHRVRSHVQRAHTRARAHVRASLEVGRRPPMRAVHCATPCSSKVQTRQHKWQSTCRERRCFWRLPRNLPRCFASAPRARPMILCRIRHGHGKSQLPANTRRPTKQQINKHRHTQSLPHA